MVEESRTLLVAEDDPEIAGALETYGTQRGFRVFTALDGESALSVGLRERPQVILLDIALPKLDGRDVFLELQKAGVTEHAVVLFTTARSTQLDRLHGLDLGADEYETKPYHLRSLFNKIDALLQKKLG